MVYVLVQHACEDYAKWRPIFDQHDGFRRASGGSDYQVFRDAADPNSVTVLMEFDSIENAHRFAASDDLRQAMMKAGVVGQPQVHFLSPA